MKITKENYNFWNKHNQNAQHSVISGHVPWDTATKIAPVHRGWIETPLIKKNIQLSERPLVAEIGCGIGRLLKEFAKDYFVAGFDISAGMIKRAREYLNEHTIKVICLNQITYAGDIIKPLDSFPDKFDLVFSFLVFQHIQTDKEIENYIHHMTQMLKPGGYIRVQTHVGTPHPEEKFGGFHGRFFPTLEEFVEKFYNTDLTVVESEHGLGHKDWLWVTAKKG